MRACLSTHEGLPAVILKSCSPKQFPVGFVTVQLQTELISIYIHSRGDRPVSLQIATQLSDFRLQRLDAVVSQRHAEELMTVNDSAEDGARRLIRVALDVVRDLHHVPSQRDHLLDRRTAVGVAAAVRAVGVPRRSGDVAGKRSPERARFHDQHLHAESADLLRQRFVHRLDCELAGGVRAASGTGYEAVCVMNVVSRCVCGPSPVMGMRESLTYPAPLLMRIIWPDPFARMTGKHARTARMGP